MNDDCEEECKDEARADEFVSEGEEVGRKVNSSGCQKSVRQRRRRSSG